MHSCACLRSICWLYADVAQLARASPCHGEGREFESRHPLHFYLSMKKFFFPLLLLLLAACSQKELKPEEAEWLALVEPAEAIVASGNTDTASCNELKKLYSDAEVAFKKLLPQLQGIGIRNKDMRMGVIKKYRDKDCRR